MGSLDKFEEVKDVLVTDYDVEPETADEVLKMVEPETFKTSQTVDEVAEYIYTTPKYWTE